MSPGRSGYGNATDPGKEIHLASEIWIFVLRETRPQQGYWKNHLAMLPFRPDDIPLNGFDASGRLLAAGLFPCRLFLFR